MRIGQPRTAGRRRPEFVRKTGRRPPVLVIGDAAEVPAIAACISQACVAAIGRVTVAITILLRQQGVDVVGESLDECPPTLLRRAERIVIAGATDATTVELVTRLLRTPEVKAQLQPLVDEGALAETLDRHGRISTLHRPAVVARAVLAQHPPTLPDRACPPPIVVGTGTVARELVTRIVVGWGEVGEPMVVHCVGAAHDWASAAAAEVGALGNITWTEVPLMPAPVLRHLDSLLADWRPPPLSHAQSAGPTVFVALDAPEVGVPLATMLAQNLPGVRVVALSPAAEPWDALRNESDGDVEVLSISETLAAAVEQPETTDSMLAEQLLADAALSEDQTLLGRLRMEGRRPAPLSVQSREVRSRIAAVAGAVAEVLRAGGVVLSPGFLREAERIVVTPGELRRMGERILGLLGLPDTNDNRLLALELGSRLPVVAARAGFNPRRATEESSLLSPETLDLLAPLVHHAYQQVGYATNNVTGSPWLYETWEGLEDYVKASNRAVLTGSVVGFAMEKLDWVASENPTVVEFDEARVGRLAVLEHRRWVDHQRHNGRPEHTYVVPWDDLDEATKEYDRVIVRALPRLLAHAGIQLVERDATELSCD